MRTDGYRYMEMRTDNGAGKLRGVGLFDLDKDPDENRNVAEDPAYGKVRAKLKGILDATRETWK